jgi:uncharacterized membrane protein YbjE (DUF340 family)
MDAASFFLLGAGEGEADVAVKVFLLNVVPCKWREGLERQASRVMGASITVPVCCCISVAVGAPALAPALVFDLDHVVAVAVAVGFGFGS